MVCEGTSIGEERKIVGREEEGEEEKKKKKSRRRIWKRKKHRNMKTKNSGEQVTQLVG